MENWGSGYQLLLTDHPSPFPPPALPRTCSSMWPCPSELVICCSLSPIPQGLARPGPLCTQSSAAPLGQRGLAEGGSALAEGGHGRAWEDSGPGSREGRRGPSRGSSSPSVKLGGRKEPSRSFPNLFYQLWACLRKHLLDKLDFQDGCGADRASESRSLARWHLALVTASRQASCAGMQRAGRDTPLQLFFL